MNNEVLNCIKSRRSIRSYKDKMPSSEEITQIVNAGLMAPSGLGKESPIIIVVKDKDMKDKISKLNAKTMGRETDPFYGSPVVLIVLANKEVPTYIYDGSCTMMNMMIAAKSLNISSCWVHRAKEVFNSSEGKKILKSLNIPDNYEGIGNLIIGYATEYPSTKKINSNRVYYL